MPEFGNGGVDIHYRSVGQGHPVLFLHGFPQTHAMWSPIVPRFSERHLCIAPDLRGYGASAKPEPSEDLSSHSFRAMARDQIALMDHLGIERIHVIGHDRGARVAHRLALDAPDRLSSVTLMDIIPTRHLLDNWSIDLARAYYHWTYLAQPAPLPERMIGADPDSFFESCLLGWGGASLADFPEIDRYRRAWRDRACIEGMICDYRAGVTIDYAHDRADAGRLLDIPVCVVMGRDGVMARSFDIRAVWDQYLTDARYALVPGGHFFVDQSPRETADALLSFLATVDDQGAGRSA